MDVDDLMPNAPEWDALGNLFGAYLHQDYDLEHGDAWSAIAAFRTESPVEAVRSAESSARRLADQLTSDGERQRAADKLRLDYYPPADGYTYRGWLIALADFLETGNRPDA